MDFRTMIQTGPVRANEVFGKLAETSDAAVKQRGKLFAELKAELEQHMQMEQDHLLPILRRHPDTKDLAAAVVKDNTELRTRLAELDGQPKNDAAFQGRLATLRKAFRQHGRNDRKELLPVVQAALRDDKAEQHPPATAQQAGQPAADAAKTAPSLAAAARARQEATSQQANPAPEAAGNSPGSQGGKQPAASPGGIEPSLAAATQAKHAEQREAQATAARERAENGNGDQPTRPASDRTDLAAAVLAKQAEAEQQERRHAEQARQADQARQAALAASQEQVRQRLEQAEGEAARERLRQAALRPVAETAAAVNEGVSRIGDTVSAGMARVGSALRGPGRSDVPMAQSPARSAALGAGLPLAGIAEFGTAWLGFLGQQAAAATQMTRSLAERQRQLTLSTWRGMLDVNASAIRLTLHVAQQGLDLSAVAGSARGMHQAARPVTPGQPGAADHGGLRRSVS